MGRMGRPRVRERKVNQTFRTTRAVQAGIRQLCDERRMSVDELITSSLALFAVRHSGEEFAMRFFPDGRV